MKIEAADFTELRPMIEAVVAATVDRIRTDRDTLGDRIAFPEAEAAALLGIEAHVLRDCRLRGEIAGSRVGKKTLYERNALLRFLESRRIEA